jgi:hypothetical protein
MFSPLVSVREISGWVALLRISPPVAFAETVLNAPELAVVVPIAPGAAHVFPSNWLAFITPEVAVPPP